MSDSNEIAGAALRQTAAVRVFGGWQRTFEHDSEACSCVMRFSVYLPPQAETGPVPVLFWLSGLTCTDENFMTKAGAQRVAAELGIALVAPDTSPRGEAVADDDAYDLGQGAGFYVNATEEPWRAHYRMFDYIDDELPRVLFDSDLSLDPERRGLFGHSMGGHGALVLGLRRPDRYGALSAFAPICSPTRCPWGEKALSAYLGDDRSNWADYDATLLLDRTESAPPLLVDQGGDDQFLEEQLHPHLLQEVCGRKGHDLTYRLQPGYDHSYYFIATFVEDHLRFHAEHLSGP